MPGSSPKKATKKATAKKAAKKAPKTEVESWFINEEGEPYPYPASKQKADYPNDFHQPYPTEAAAQEAADALIMADPNSTPDTRANESLEVDVVVYADELNKRPVLKGTSVVRLVHETQAVTIEGAITDFIEMVNRNGLRSLVYVVTDEEGNTYAERGDGYGSTFQ